MHDDPADESPAPDAAPDAPSGGPTDAGPGSTPPPTGAPADRPSQEERTWAMVAHLCGIGSSLVLPIVVSLVIYLVKKDESDFVRDQAAEAVNFQVTTLIAAIVSVALFCIGIGVLMIWAVGLIALVFGLIGAIKSFDGERYRYPFSLRPL